MRRRKSAVVKKDNENADRVLEESTPRKDFNSITMKEGGMAHLFGKALVKKFKLLDDLNQSAVFTIRKSTNNSKSRGSPKKSQDNKPRVSSPDDVSGCLDRTPSPGANSSAPSPTPPSLKNVTPRDRRDGPEEMSLYGEFIILTTVNALLVDNINFAYQVSQTDFTDVTGSSLFSGNINRLKALAAEQIFLRYFDPKDGTPYHMVQYLVEAIQAAEEALRHYKGEGLGSSDKVNEYGVALQNFHLGYLKETYARRLSTKASVDTFHEVCRDMTEGKFQAEARDHFHKAHTHFEDVNHLKGMYIAKKHEVALLEASLAGNIDASDREYKRARRKLQDSKSDYQSYVADYGYQHCCHVPRLHGDVWSLLTEVVVNYHKKDLFREPRRSEK